MHTSRSFEIAGFTSIDISVREEIKSLIGKLIAVDDVSRPDVAGSILQIVENHCAFDNNDPLLCEFSGLIIDYMLSYFLSVKSSHESVLYHFLGLINHSLVTAESPYYHTLQENLKPVIAEFPQAMELYDRLQLLYIFTENHDFDSARTLINELESVVTRQQAQLWVLFHLAKARVLRHENKIKELMRMRLLMIVETYEVDSSDSAINFLLRWIIVINWQRHTVMKKALLMRVYGRISDQKSLNCAFVLYELFTFEDRLVPSAEKLGYQKKLIKFPASILNVQQLQILYFFAGNYSCGVQSHFKESIQNYQYSNYFLHKCWERLLSLSSFMRKHMEPEQYYKAMPFLDIRIHELSDQVSMQNNAYVESLQADYNKIEELYEKVGELSLTDSLTGLRNRRYLENNLFQMVVLAARHKVPVCFSMIDIDFFKLTNDTFGHLAGDYVLKELAKILINEFRKSDIIIRYGGEEFLVILFDSDVDRSIRIMDDLRLKISQYNFEYRHHVIPVTVSIGISCDNTQDPNHSDLNKFITHADTAMYQAKNEGRNRLAVFTTGTAGICDKALA
ncbi:MAG: GGDEF domain-containing protein [Candidatus Cloacimonetes bacterium HGW-Cloacimonetes-3]|jgi:diguanylate cyclase (GGDEF)-like protein|nr:MAG: GGDEF domain-containing protein [Candidatus Cloacimonetes bacterium HGW-Cloacimonetes-3]